MNRVAWQLVRSGGWGRPVLVAVSTALATAIVLVAATWTLLPENSPEVFAVISETGTRVGAVVGALLVALAPLLLLDQVVRLGTAARERRQAALRLAGATPREARRVGLLEVGLPAVVGAVLAPLLVLALPRYAPSRADGASAYQGYGQSFSTRDLVFLPAHPLPPWYVGLAVIASVAAAAIVVGAWSSRRVSVSPLGVTRRQRRADPRPWPLLLFPGGLLLAGVVFRSPWGDVADSVATITMLLLIVLSLLLSAPWVAWRAGRRAEHRARDAVHLIAARHLVADPRPAGRAGSALAAIFLVFGGCIGILPDLLDVGGGGGGDDTYYLIGLGMALTGLLAAFVVAIGSLAVHSVESMTDRKRPMAALAALGTERSTLRRVRGREIAMVATPLAGTGAVIGSLLMSCLSLSPPLVVAATALVALVAALALVRAASWLAIAATEPWMRDLGDPVHLRTA